MTDAGAGGHASARRVLFTFRPDWEAPIRSRLDPVRYAAVMAPLGAADPAAFDAVVPLRLEECAALRTGGRGRFLVPPEATLALCDDKLALNDFLMDAGLGLLVPTVFTGLRPAFPYVLKRRRDEAGQHTRLIRNPAEEAACGPHSADGGFFRQEAIFGTSEWATHVLARDGRTLYHLDVESPMPTALAIKGVQAAAISRIAHHGRPLDPWLASAIAALRYSGIACIDYKIADGVPRVFEINPRPGWSLHMDINGFLDAYLAALDI